jgi:serine/threonine protein kinase
MRAVEAHRTLGGGSLSPDLEAAAARRLGALALVVAGISATMGTIEIAGGLPSALPAGVRAGFMFTAIFLSCALRVVIARGWVGTRRALDLGLGFQAIQALLTAVPFHAMSHLPGVEVRGWTPVATWTLVYPLVVPGSTRRVVLGSLVTAAMDPLGLWLAVAAGAPAPVGAALVRTFLSTVLAAVVVPIAARIVYGLALEVKRAREMGSYRLAEKLGEGGMGEVWRAEHRMLARGAAIKLIRPDALGAPTGSHAGEIMKRFQREAQATAGLRSPHTIEVYDYGIAADGTFHYVMELLDGFSLQTLVERFGPVPPERAVRFLRQACHSLAEAHAAGLVHRDVKPANMFACRLGLDVDFVKVLDFGLVKVQGPRAAGAEELTAAGSFAGTPAFMPPEIALGNEAVDSRADIYALGCVGYWLLTGRLVFESGSAMQMVIDHVRTPPPAPSRRAAQRIPEGLERIILRCLAKDPARRPSSAAALSRELQWLGIEGRWTEARAREWWRTHEGLAVPDKSGRTFDLSTLETRPRVAASMAQIN